MSQTWDPENYARNARFVAELGMPVVDLLAPQPGERILDLGCGDGALTAKLVELGCRVTGVDASPEQIGAAQARGLDARVVDAQALPFEAQFDAVFSNATLHWIQGNIARICAALYAALRERHIDPVSLDPWYFPGTDEYRERLERRGFRVVEIALFARPTALPGDIAGWLETFAGSFLAAVPDGERPALMAELREALRPDLCDEDGRWTADYVRLRFAAIKPANDGSDNVLEHDSRDAAR
jgi:SAM-dependent methyltransferase